MIVVNTREEITQKIKELRAKKGVESSVGFVPTMGALHEGHLSLIAQCKEENDITVVSIFVNPIQFNNPTDFERYPRTLEDDLQKIAPLDVDIVFAPKSPEEIYFDDVKYQFDFGSLDKVMEGEFRPGHFDGVAQVVYRLFDIVKPDKAYFGEKDFQQLAIIRDMVRQKSLPVEITGVPIKRNSSGLALSSRNMLLTDDQRARASRIHSTLVRAKELYGEMPLSDLKRYVISEIEKDKEMKVEYLSICNGNTLLPIGDDEVGDYVVACITVYMGDVRLIDNLTILKS